jgi:hypothetical protein
MPAVQQWGRKESIVWPSRHYLNTLGALFLSLVLTGFFVYVGFQYGLPPLERYYLPYHLRSDMAVLTHPASTYQLLYVSDGKLQARVALGADLEPCLTPQFMGKPFAALALVASRAERSPLAVPRKITQLFEQGSSPMDQALDLWGCSCVQPLHHATRLRPRREYLERTGPSGKEAAEVAARSTRDRKEVHSP